MRTKWLNHVSQYKLAHGCTYKEALQQSSRTYRGNEDDMHAALRAVFPTEDQMYEAMTEALQHYKTNIKIQKESVHDDAESALKRVMETVNANASNALKKTIQNMKTTSNVNQIIMKREQLDADAKKSPRRNQTTPRSKTPGRSQG